MRSARPVARAPSIYCPSTRKARCAGHRRWATVPMRALNQHACGEVQEERLRATEQPRVAPAMHQGHYTYVMNEGAASAAHGKSHFETLVKLRWPAVVLAVTLLAWFATRHFFNGLQKAIPTALEWKITDEFVAAIPTLERGGGMKLEVAVATSTETFQRSDELKVASISMGKTVTRITVPVIYRYHI